MTYNSQKKVVADIQSEIKTKRQEVMDEREEYENELDNITERYDSLKEYFEEREKVGLLEIIYFLEYQYPSDSREVAIGITKDSTNQITYSTTSIERIAQLKEGFEKWQEKGFIRSFEAGGVDHMELGSWKFSERVNVYTMTFSFEPDAIRDFLVNGDAEIDFLPPKETEKFLQYFYNINLLEDEDIQED